MATGSLATLQKNALNAFSGVSKMATAAPGAFATWKKWQDRRWTQGPSHIQEQAEFYEPTTGRRRFCQRKNMWVDKELDSEVSHKEMVELINFKQDMWKAIHWGMWLPLVGVYALPLYAWGFATNNYTPRCFNNNAEQLADWRRDQDLMRYKHSPSYCAQERWWFNFYINMSEEGGAIFDNLVDKNTVPKDPVQLRRYAESLDMTGVNFIHCRRTQMRSFLRALTAPTTPWWNDVNAQVRLRDFWDLTWNEDYMVVKGQLHKTMSSEDLHDYAWRRFLAPYDQGLSTEQVMDRVEKYHTFLGPNFLREGYTPNIWVCQMYCLGNYHEASYLTEDIKDLENCDDYVHLQTWAKDAFLQRMEFENGPLRDQVEAHSFKALEERKKKLE